MILQMEGDAQTVAHQTPLPLEFFRQEYCSRLPFPPPGHLPDPGIESASLVSPKLAGRFFTTWEALLLVAYAGKIEKLV